MRLVFVASNFGNTWATETHVAHEFAELGWDVHKLHEHTTLEAIERNASEADLVLYMKAHGLSPHATQMWQRLEARGVRTASFHLDLYYGLPRGDEIGVDPTWRTGTVFTADGDPGLAEYCKQRDINHVWMPAAIVHDEIGYGRDRADLHYDVGFTGMVRGYHPQWPWREEMLRHLSTYYIDRFRAWHHGDQIRDAVLNDVCTSCKVMVGDSLSLPGHRNYWSDRFYEQVGRGALFVGPRVPGIEQHFTEGEHLLLYEPCDVDSLLATVDAALELSRDERAQIVGDGMAHVAAHHTYRHRVLAMLEQMGVRDAAH